MNRPYTALALICFLLLGAIAGAQAVLSSPELTWHGNRRTALDEARKAGKPIILYFNNRRAIDCRDLEQITFREKSVVDRMKDFVLVATDITAEQDLRRSMKIIKVPTVIFMNSDGVEQFRAVGNKDPQDFLNYLNAVPRGRAAAGGSGPGAGNSAAAASSAQPTPAYNPSAAALNKRQGTETIRFTYYGPSNLQVILAGDFNDWSESLMPMRKDPSGWFWLDLHIPQGLYEYKFIVDGTWTEDSRAAIRREVPEYNTYNSILKVGNPPMRPLVRGDTVTFLFYSRDAKDVRIAGSFTSWVQTPMFAKGDGNWGIQYDLPRGTYQYKFIVDGEWMLDPGNYISERDSTSNVNSSFTIR